MNFICPYEEFNFSSNKTKTDPNRKQFIFILPSFTLIQIILSSLALRLTSCFDQEGFDFEYLFFLSEVLISGLLMIKSTKSGPP